MYLLLFGAQPLGIEMEVRVEVGAARPMVLEGDDGPVGHLGRHGGVLQPVPLQGGLV